ncbi:hypothetical protein [uncultured Treponema sp.]|uniref:hypothetical protein n=1 Tax=uncultured Treponema sp. TaxID=162155 RepID=UPI0025D54F2D|nr:hypothetical protein [uncultured Treponema sp.]
MFFGSQENPELLKMAEILAERTDSDLSTVQRNVEEIARTISKNNNIDFDEAKISVYRKLIDELKEDFKNS